MTFWKLVTERITNFLKKKFSIPQAVFALCLLVALLLATLWFALPLILESQIKEMGRDAGIGELEVKVSEVDPWKTKMLNWSGESGGKSMTIDQVEVLYDPAGIAMGKVNALSVTGLSASPNPAKNEKSGNFDWEEFFSTGYGLIDKLLLEPPLSYLRVRDSAFSMTAQDQTSRILFRMATDFLEGLTHLTWEADFMQASAYGEINLTRDGNATFISSRVNLGDAGSMFDALSSDLNLQEILPEDLEITAGSLIVDGLTRIVPTGLEDLFLELNGSDFQFGWGDHNFSVPKLMVFFMPENEDQWECNSYANVRYGNHLLADEINLSIIYDQKGFGVQGGVNYLKTQDPFPPVEITGLRFPNIDLDPDEFEFPGNQERQVSFDELSYDNQFFRMYNGLFSFHLKDQRIDCKVPPLDAALLDLGISFVQFSYVGSVDPQKLPQVNSPQLITGQKVISGDEVLLEDLMLSFRVKDASHFLIDVLTMNVGGDQLDFSPANIIFGIPGDHSPNLSVQFKKSSLFLPGQEVRVTGLEGEIQFNSLEPIETNGTQTIQFESLTVDGFEMRNGFFSFAILPDGTFLIAEGRAELFGGVMGLMESSFTLDGEEMKLITTMEKMNGQDIADLIEELEVEVNGSFSGRIPLLNAGGKWDFERGFLQLDPSPNATLRYQSNGFLTRGIEEGSEEFERMKMTEMALENLKLDSLRITFEVEGAKRQVMGDIRGKSMIRKNTEVSLDYRPKIIAGLAEIIQKMNLNKVGL